MVKRVEVTDPHTGVTLKVREDSPQAKVWGKPKRTEKEAPKSTKKA